MLRGICFIKLVCTGLIEVIDQCERDLLKWLSYVHGT